MNTVRKAVAGMGMLSAITAFMPAANATPYAFAANQITGLTITYANGSAVSPIVSATTNESDSALYGTSPGSLFQGQGTVGNALTINQAYSGPDASPPPVNYTPDGPASFTGTRSDAAIGAGSAASGGVSISNVAEGYGGAPGNSTGNNSSAITFQVVGTGLAIRLAFTDLVDLVASTAATPQETSTASITNTFSVTPSTSSTPLSTFAPSTLNQQLSSQFGSPATNSFTNTASYTFTSAVLTAGQTYDISLSSGSSENIQPGVATPVPEPASLAVLGMGLLGLGMVARRKRI